MAETKRTTAVKLTEWKEMYADNAEFVAYCEAELTKISNKAAKAKERAAEKREAGCDLRDAVEAILANATEPMTREMILAAFDNAEEMELTVAKVGHQASELVKYGKAHKVDVRIDSKTKVGYVIGPDAE